MGGYVAEGHVPASDVRRPAAAKPKAAWHYRAFRYACGFGPGWDRQLQRRDRRAPTTCWLVAQRRQQPRVSRATTKASAMTSFALHPSPVVSSAVCRSPAHQRPLHWHRHLLLTGHAAHHTAAANAQQADLSARRGHPRTLSPSVTLRHGEPKNPQHAAHDRWWFRGRTPLQPRACSRRATRCAFESEVRALPRHAHRKARRMAAAGRAGGSGATIIRPHERPLPRWRRRSITRVAGDRSAISPTPAPPAALRSARGAVAG